jgi:hypothetical protein
MEHGVMVKCPFINQGGSVCETNVPEYVTHWFILFAAILSPIFIALSVFRFETRLERISQGGIGPPSFLGLYQRHRPHVRLFDEFVFLFSRGILHARIYSS